jgi:hypothetical protein
MDGNTLERVYQENLEERLISYLASENKLTYEEAMDKYYRSKMANRIYNGENDIQYLDYKVLADMIKEYEPELFE